MNLTRSQITLDWVRRHSQARGNDRLVLLAIAWWTKSDGTAQVPVSIIMSDAGCSRASAFKALASCEGSGILDIDAKKGRVASTYRVRVPKDYDPSKDEWDNSSGKWIIGTGEPNVNSLPAYTVEPAENATQQSTRIDRSDSANSSVLNANSSVLGFQQSTRVDATSIETSIETSTSSTVSQSDGLGSEGGSDFYGTFADAATNAIMESERAKGTVIKFPLAFRRSIRESFDEGGARHEDAKAYVKANKDDEPDATKLGTYYVTGWPDRSWDEVGAERLVYREGALYRRCHCGPDPKCDVCEGTGLVLDTPAPPGWGKPVNLDALVAS